MANEVDNKQMSNAPYFHFPHHSLPGRIQKKNKKVFKKTDVNARCNARLKVQTEVKKMSIQSTPRKQS